MTFRLVDTGWDKELGAALLADHSAIRIVCPFLKKRTVERLFAHGRPKALQVITRFALDDFCQGVSDLSALRLLLERGAQIRGVRSLHAKLYLVGAGRAIVTSANLTEAAMLRNHELGFVADEPTVVGPCRQYFEKLWAVAGPDLQFSRLDYFDSKVTAFMASGAPPKTSSGLPDEGFDAGLPETPVTEHDWTSAAGQGFVKLFGEGHRREPGTMLVLEEVRRSGCHWACTYPYGRRPRSVQDGATMFMARLVKDPHDVLIFGRAEGMSHEEGRDDATPSDKALRPWKAKWPHYVRVRHPEFLAGTLSNGVSLNDMMDELKSDAFASTQRNKRAGTGNIDPRASCKQKPAMELTPQSIAWLTKRLEIAYARHGKMPAATLAKLDWPALPSATSPKR